MEFIFEFFAQSLGSYIRWNLSGRKVPLGDFTEKNSNSWLDATIGAVSVVVITFFGYGLYNLLGK